jgi:arabinan endo-1,5-alpha-L-arabinosidase
MNKVIKNIKCIVFLLAILFHTTIASSQQADNKIPAHDHVMIKQDNTYYMFCTGFGITVYSSTDMKSWKRPGSGFFKSSEWAVKAVQGFQGHVWAPDISYHNYKYYLYYAVSAFGKNTSCIGVDVNSTLDSSAANFGWKDLGKVIQSVPERDMWNAIDPNLIVDENNTPG